jgi:molybdopterin-guanine dinucleotide biosynthesis protein A
MGTDKALMEIDGRPLVLRVAARLSEVAAPIFLAPGRPGRLGPLGYPEVGDEGPGGGPLAGLVAGLALSPHPLVAVVAVDLPLANPEVFRLLAGLHTDEDAVVPVSATGPEPLHAVYHRAALPALRACLAEGSRSLRDALATRRVREVTEAEWRPLDHDGRFALNLNRPEDLAVLGESIRPSKEDRT